MIDRKALVSRHNPVIRGFDRYSCLSVGNGEYAFTVDATGLQTYPEEYEKDGVPLGHYSNWAWHTDPNPEGYRMEDFKLTYYETFNGRSVGFPYMPSGQMTEEYKFLKLNPHRLHLGRIQFSLKLEDGEPAQKEHLSSTEQVLDLWSGVITSRFELAGKQTTVQTCCHPDKDMIAIHVESELIRTGQLQVAFHFPYGEWSRTGVNWGNPEGHRTDITAGSSTSACLVREMDQTSIAAQIMWSAGKLVRDGEDAHRFLFIPDPMSVSFELSFLSVPTISKAGAVNFQETLTASSLYWEGFWSRGAAVELIESNDERAAELERRIILSQYLTAIQSSGSLPPQESGLTHNSWAGKFHLEMHWWHAVHFAYWNRHDLLENSLAWYRSILGKAQETAAFQGYEGARWPKCVPPDGVNAPCYIEPFLVWQQPHPIYYAELIHRITGSSETLALYAEIVFETAAFMASYAEWDEPNQRYVLGAPIAPAQEIYDHATTMNPTFELSYWSFGLSTANAWKEKLGQPRVELWDHVIAQLSPLPVVEGLYVAAETASNTFTEKAGLKDHPTMLAPLGLLPGCMVEEGTMRRTLEEVVQQWDWDATWGWDYPMAAMTAARLGEGKLALDLLLMDKKTNTFLPNGHNYQRPPLPTYLPGNGGLLTTVAMMAAGWDGGPDLAAPGFPQDGTWTVRHEGLIKMI